MNTTKLLDCTLRDGGYINDWNFGFHTIKSIIRQLVESQVDYVEVGFLRNCQYDRNKALYNNCGEIVPVLPQKRGNTLFTAMALHNRYDINKLEDYDGKTIDAIRVTFHDYDIDEGLSFIEKAKENLLKSLAQREKISTTLMRRRWPPRQGGRKGTMIDRAAGTLGEGSQRR